MWDDSRDVVVVGSGNGALTAALCLHDMGVRDVMVIEKSREVGGTSALSGGGIWVPGNHYAAAAGIEDSLDEARDYALAANGADDVPARLVETYIEQAPRMLRFLHERSRVRYVSLAHYPDYFSDLPGARPGHRSLEPEPVDITRLADRGQRLKDGHPILRILNRVPMTQTEAHSFNGQAPGWQWAAAKLLLHYFLDLPQRLRTRQSRRATCGSAGVARLLWSLEERQVPVALGVELKDLVVQQGRVTGVVVEQAGRVRRIGCRRAVVLATGGFEHDQALREQYLPQPTQAAWSTTHKANTGTAVTLARRHGARLRRMEGAWWVPTFRVPGIAHPYPSIMEKSYPGSCVVDARGQRVANESMNYQLYVRECHRLHASGTDTSRLWLIFDADFRRKYIVSPILTSRLMPDWMIPRAYFCPEFLTRADSLDDLARAVGIDAAGLGATIARFNGFAASGEDADFGRGNSVYDRYYGDPAVTPNPCLAPIARPPFYAVRIYLGEFGSNGGLDIDENGQVLADDGRPIGGLYANGNCAAAVLPSYPGPGATLGPAMTFAYQAARHIAGYNMAP